MRHMQEVAKAGHRDRRQQANASVSMGRGAEHPILYLQRTIGNQAVQRLLQSGRLQAKLTISQPGDPFERKADDVADKVMRMAEPTPIGSAPTVIQRKCAGCEDEKEKSVPTQVVPLMVAQPSLKGAATFPVALQNVEGQEEEYPPVSQAIIFRRAEFAAPRTTVQSAPSITDRLLKGQAEGEPLPAMTRQRMENAFGHGFSRVRVHRDAEADEISRQLSALAFTHGSHIYFGNGMYDPDGSLGKRLLAHELTHVVQQGQAAPQQSSEAATPTAAVQAATPTIQRVATWAAGAVHQTNNLANSVVNGPPVGVTWPTLNGSTFWSTAAARALLRKPTLAFSSAAGGVNAEVATVPTNTGSFDETVLAPGPWTMAALKARIGTMFPTLAACTGAGNSTFRAIGNPSDAAMAAANQRHEDHHANDHHAAFNGSIVPLDTSLTTANTAGTTFNGPTEVAAEAALYAAMGGLQRVVGNRVVGRLIQAKLQVGQPGNKYEREADHVARRITMIPTSEISPVSPYQVIPEEKKEKEEFVQRKALAENISPLVQRHMEDDEEAEDKENLIQAKFLPEASWPHDPTRLLIQRAWKDADASTYPVPKSPSQPPTPIGGWNAANQTIGVVERIPIEGLMEGLQGSTKRSAKEQEAEKPGSRSTKESENGKAIAVVPIALKPGQPVEVLLHLHGHNVGYRERSKAGDGMAEGSVRDVATDRIEQQIGASGRNMIGILPQGTTMSGFGAFNPDAYIAEVWSQLVAMKKLQPDAKRGTVVLSGHSGAAAPITQMLVKGNVPTGLGELVLFDAIHSGQRPPVEAFLKTRMAADVKTLQEIADPTLNGGLDAAAVTTKQTEYLAGSFRFRGIFTPKFHPQKKDDSGVLMWQDPETKKKPLLDESVWSGYGVEYEPLRDFIKNWIDTNTKSLAPGLVTALRENYKVIPAGAGATHNTIMGVNSNLQSALSALPVTVLAPQPAPPKTGAVESISSDDIATAVASTEGILEESARAPAFSETEHPAEETVIQAKRDPSGYNPGIIYKPVGPKQVSPLWQADDGAHTRIAGHLQHQAGNRFVQGLIQRAPSPAVLTDAQQWDQDWTTYAAQQHYFAGNDRPAGTPRHRYDVLCPLYKAHDIPIPRPMVYMATSITTAKCYTFSTPAHNDMATALSTAESTLKGKGYASAPFTSLWALNPRTTSAGGWSNHADGRAVDIDPNVNPHIIEQKERQVITLVTDTDIDKGGQGYDVMKGVSDMFKAGYNPAGLQRRIDELTATEKAKETERDTVKSQRDTRKEQRDTLKFERDGLKKQLKTVPQGKKATAADVANATNLKAGIQQKEADIKQVEKEIKQKESDLKKKEAELKRATNDRKLMEKQLTMYQTTEQAITDLENSVKLLPDETKSLEDQIAQSKQDEQDAKDAKNSKGVQAQQKLRATLQRALAKKKAELKKKQTQLDAKKKQRDADPLRKYAVGGFLNLLKDVVEAMTGAGLKWGGNWTGAKDFMHFEL